MMQLRSGKKIGQEQSKVKSMEQNLKKSKTPTSFDEHVFVSHMKHLLTCIQDSPSRSMERLGCIHEMMQYANLDVNSGIAKHHKFCPMMIFKCDELQHDLLAMVADRRPQLTNAEKTTAMRLHDIMAETRTKYQGYVSTNTWKTIFDSVKINNKR
jgi:hypothetical protein